MKIDYKITDEDKQKYISSDLNTKKKTIPKIMVFVSSIILLLISLMALIAKDYAFATPILIFLAIIHLLVNLPKLLKKKYIKSIDVNEERSVQVNDDSLTVANSSRTTIYKYSDIKSVDLINNYFVLIKFKLGDSVVIPGSAFSNTDDNIDFINKIKTNARII
jgi:hypothetical protein